MGENLRNAVDQPVIKIFRIALLILILISLINCDNANNDEFQIVFYADSTASLDNSISLDSLDSSNEDLLIIVKAIHIFNGNAHAAFFDILFDGDIMRFDSFESGDFFESGGEVSYQIGLDSHNPNRLIVGVSLLGSGAFANDSGYIVKLHFKPVRYGNCRFQFENESIVEETEFGDFQMITGISWYGGMAQILE